MQELYVQGEQMIPRPLLKTQDDIAGIKASAAVNMGALDLVAERIGVGVTTQQIDEWVYDYCIKHDAIPADLNYEGYPKSVCTSINNVICHGIPSKNDILQEGDIVNVDMSTIKGGYYSDSSRMFCIGQVAPEAKRLVDVTRQAMQAGIDAVRPWTHLGDVGHAVHMVAKKAKFSVVSEYGGHGCGNEFHEDPFVSFVSEPGTGPIMVPGMCFTIEPMINAGKAKIKSNDPNGWTVRTKDGSLSAQWEVQVLVTETGHELLSW